MFGKKKVTLAPETIEQKAKPTPAYLREDYPYKAVGEPISDISSLQDTGILYEIKCPKCEMSIRSQGINIKSTYERLLNGVDVTDEDGTVRKEGGKGCIGCSNRELLIFQVDMSKMAGIKAQREERSQHQQ